AWHALSDRRVAEPAAKPAERAADDAGVLTMTAVGQQNIGLAVVPAEMRPIARTIRATGMVGADETRLVRMRPLSRGRLLQAAVDLGARVHAGQVIATYDNIETGDLTGELAAAQAGLTQARAEADATHKALERTRELVAVGGVARAEVERRVADEARAIAAVRTQEAEIAKLGEKLRRFGIAPSAGVGHSAPTPIVAPIDGVVIRVDVVPGETVDANREIYTIADLSTVWVQADVLERDLALIRPGLQVDVGVAGYSDRRFAGEVSYVADMLDPKTNTARVRCAVANPDGALKLNMFAAIEIAVPTGHAGVTVPAGALQYVDDQPIVFVRKDAEHFERRDVHLGVEQRAWIELADGVAAGEPVVTTGSFALKSILLHDRIAGD
ncbi:MAG TPA: efflux RND transporter periplasmic adaptor subunit, partial [Candidatus Sulfotelmatobacter sp.]|nr:efflux RND transporter periplasmic adaptor subunit [Candidatus Sulfotelmatobacter sp.]